jgi:hypothetical protein
MHSPFDSIQLIRSALKILVGSIKRRQWIWPARVEAEWRLFSKAVVSGLLRLTTAFDS